MFEALRAAVDQVDAEPGRDAAAAAWHAASVERCFCSTCAGRRRRSGDTILGGRGSDHLYGGPGLASLTGGSGADGVGFDAESGDAISTDFGARDKLDLSGFGFDRDRARGARGVR